MSRFRTIVVTVAGLLLAAGPAVAAVAPPRSAATNPKPGSAAGKANSARPEMSPEQAFELMSRVMDKVLPAGPAPDPVRLAAARSNVAVMLPDGVIATEIDRYVEVMGNHLLSMTEADFVDMLPEEKAKRKTAPSTVPLREMAAKEIPDFDRKFVEAKAIVKRMAIKFGALAEPRLRDGLAQVMARDFTGPQLAEIGGFLKTPTGAQFAKSSTLMWWDRELMRAMFQLYPELIRKAPEFMPDAMALAALFEKPKDSKPAK